MGDVYLTLTGNSASVDLRPDGKPWLAANLWVLLDTGQADDDAMVMPSDGYVPAVRSYPAQLTITEYALDVVIDGAYDPDDEPAADPAQQLLDNQDFLRTELVVPPANSTGLRDATLHEPGGGTRTAPVKVLRLDPKAAYGGNPTMLSFSLIMSLPFGRFA